MIQWRPRVILDMPKDTLDLLVEADTKLAALRKEHDSHFSPDPNAMRSPEWDAKLRDIITKENAAKALCESMYEKACERFDAPCEHEEILAKLVLMAAERNRHNMREIEKRALK